jgi:sugar phosphate isomerase/epimerase
MRVVSTSFNVPRTSSLVAAVTEIGSMEFAGVEMAASERVGDAFEAAALCREKRLRVPTIAAPIGEPVGNLSSPDEARRNRAVSAVLSTVPIAAEAQARALIVRLGDAEGEDRTPHLEAAARSIFDLTRAVPELTFSVRTPETSRGLPDAEEMELLFEDASGRNVSYTHDAACGGTEERLSRHGPRTISVILSDRAPEIDWREVRAGLSSGMIRVIELDPNRSGAELLAFAAHLKDVGVVE